MAKRFLYVCLGVLALAIAYHLAVGPQLAQSQPGERAMLFSVDGGLACVMTDQGNIYYAYGQGDPQRLEWYFVGSWDGFPPTATQSATWGSIKAQFKE